MTFAGNSKYLQLHQNSFVAFFINITSFYCTINITVFQNYNILLFNLITLTHHLNNTLNKQLHRQTEVELLKIGDILVKLQPKHTIQKRGAINRLRTIIK